MGLDCFVLSFSPSDPVSSTGTGFESSVIKGEGDSVGCFVLLSARPLTSGLRIKSAMTVLECLVGPPCGFPHYAGMTVLEAELLIFLFFFRFSGAAHA